jgi:hypothetical protein
MVLRMLSTSEQRTYMFVTLAFRPAHQRRPTGTCAAAQRLLVPALQPNGMPVDDLHRLVVTLGIWVVFVLAAELSPVGDEVVADRS